MAPPNVIVWKSEKALLAGSKDALYGWVSYYVWDISVQGFKPKGEDITHIKFSHIG